MNAQIFIEIILTIIIIGFQVFYFITSRKKISTIESIFPKTSLDSSNVELFQNGEQYTELIAVEDYTHSTTFTEIIISINKYLERNKGAADFSIIKSIVDRKIESIEEDVASNLSLPLYIGLMGTFVGIIAGLVKIAFFGGVTEENINSFLGGVFIAMFASLIGLLLTVINNSGGFKKAKRTNDHRKTEFFNFLQVELLPYLGNSIYDVFNRFKDNIGDFNDRFSKNISLFDEKFSSNINNLKQSVTVLSDNIGPIVESTKHQKEFLKELKAIGYNRMAEANLKVFKVMSDAGPNFKEFIDKQKELNQSIDKTLEIVSVIDSVMNRVSSFEKSISELGHRIDASDYISSDLLTKVNRKLNELDNQFELLKQHSQFTKGHIENHFSQEVAKVEVLSERILGELGNALNFDVEKNPLLKLNILENVNGNILEVIQNQKNKENFEKVVSEIASTRKAVEILTEKLEIINKGDKGVIVRPPESSKEKKKNKKSRFSLNPFKLFKRRG
jgi:biopolymer transport protein ExbB/TolQ